MKETAPVFVKISNYKEVLDIVDVLKAKLNDARGTLRKINDIKAEEDRELADWNKNIEDIDKRVRIIDKTLFEPDV